MTSSHGRLAPTGSGHPRDDRFRDGGRVADNPDGCRHLLADLGWVDVHMDDRIADPARPPTGRQRSESDAHREDEVRLFERVPSQLVRHPSIAERQRMILGDDALA
jgi:hypothetical protein